MPEIIIDDIKGAENERQFAALEDDGFSVPSPGHYLDDFPIWDSQKFPAVGTVFRIGAFDGPKLVAATGVRIAEIRNAQTPLTVGLIGAVATARDYRGQGLATQLVSLATSWATQRGAALAILWGSEHQLYAKLGFAPCGTQATIPLSTWAASTAAEKVQTGWTPGLMNALKSRRTGIQIRDVDRTWMGSHKNVRWFWTGNANQVTAYAALGRGIDLPHFVHEWGGERSVLTSIFNHIHKEDPQARLLGSPALFTQAGFQYDPSAEERLCLAKVIDATAIFKSVHADPSFTAAFVNDAWKLSLSSQGKTVSDSISPLEATKLFFGPLPSGIKKPWSEFFPLPLWFWGLDAV